MTNEVKLLLTKEYEDIYLDEKKKNEYNKNNTN